MTPDFRMSFLAAALSPIPDPSHEDGSSPRNGQSHSVPPQELQQSRSDLRQELQQLRLMIKFDMKELLDVKFGEALLRPASRCATPARSTPVGLRWRAAGPLLLRGSGGGDSSTPPGSPPAASRRHGTAGERPRGEPEARSRLRTVVVSDEPDEETWLMHNVSDEDHGQEEDSGVVRPHRRSSVRKLTDLSRKIQDTKSKYTDGGFEWVRELHPESVTWDALVDRLEWAWELEEPKREGLLASIEGSRAFGTCFTVLILFNAVFIAVQGNMLIESPSGELPVEMMFAELLFLLLYMVELAVKLGVHRLYFFWSPDMQWNILDLSLVAYSLAEVAVGTIAGAAAQGGGPSWMRSLRVFRVVKVLRILRVVKAFKQLQLMVNSLVGSMVSVLWSVLMVAIIYFMFSLALLTQVRIYLADHGGSREGDNEQILQHFGSVQASMWTLFQATFAGQDWVVFYHQVEKLGLVAQCVWFTFIVFTQVAILNVLTGIFVQSALELSEGTAHDKAMRHEQQELEDALELRRLCESHDWDKSGTMSSEEFFEMLKTETCARYLQFIGLDTAHIHMFHDLIAEGGRDIDISSFVAGCMQLRGSAKSSDLVALMLDVKVLTQTQRELLDRLGDMQEALDRRSSRPTGADGRPELAPESVRCQD